MALPSGAYTILNTHYENLASLPNGNDQQPIVGVITPEATNHKVSWRIACLHREISNLFAVVSDACNKRSLFDQKHRV